MTGRWGDRMPGVRCAGHTHTTTSCSLLTLASDLSGARNGWRSGWEAGWSSRQWFGGVGRRHTRSQLPDRQARLDGWKSFPPDPPLHTHTHTHSPAGPATAARGHRLTHPACGQGRQRPLQAAVGGAAEHRAQDGVVAQAAEEEPAWGGRRGRWVHPPPFQKAAHRGLVQGGEPCRPEPHRAHPPHRRHPSACTPRLEPIKACPCVTSRVAPRPV